MDKQTKLKLSGQVLRISGIFCLIVATLLIANFWQMKKTEPLESKTLEALVERLSEDPDNEALKEEIRRFDLLARKAYFTSAWQVKTGSWLLLFGVVVFAMALKVNTDIRKQILPPEPSGEEPLLARATASRWLLSAGSLIIVLALLAAFYSADHLQNYFPEQSLSSQEAAGEDIAVIRIVDTNAQSQSVPETSELLTAEGGETTAIDEKPALEQKAPEKKFAGLEDFKRNHATFRGFLGHGISYHKNIPTDWDGASGKNIKWKVALSKPGYNSPVIWGDNIFISGGDQQSRVVTCFDRNTGRLLWEKEVSGIPGSPAVPPKVTDDTGLAAPTMAVDGNHVYAIFATGDLIAFDLEGNRIWARNIGVPENHYGHSSSLTVWRDKLIIQYDTRKSGRLLAVNTFTGETMWDVKRNNQISWSSPILIQKNDKMQIVTTSDPLVAGHDFETGAELWNVNALMGEVGPSAAYFDGLVYATNEYARNVAVRPEPGVTIVWENNDYLSEASSPVAYKGLYILGTSYGVLACYDALTGDKYWELESDHGFYSSPIIAEDRLYIIDMGGVMHIIKTDKTGTIINEPELGEAAYAIPAFADGRIYIRGKSALYCIEAE